MKINYCLGKMLNSKYFTFCTFKKTYFIPINCFTDCWKEKHLKESKKESGHEITLLARESTAVSLDRLLPNNNKKKLMD